MLVATLHSTNVWKDDKDFYMSWERMIEPAHMLAVAYAGIRGEPHVLWRAHESCLFHVAGMHPLVVDAINVLSPEHSIEEVKDVYRRATEIEQSMQLEIDTDETLSCLYAVHAVVAATLCQQESWGSLRAGYYSCVGSYVLESLSARTCHKQVAHWQRVICDGIRDVVPAYCVMRGLQECKETWL
jgi:hypothetical protein